MPDFQFTPCPSHLPFRLGGKPYPAVKIGAGCERLDAYSRPAKGGGLFKMLLSIGKRVINANGQKGWVQMVSAPTFYAEIATLKFPAAPFF